MASKTTPVDVWVVDETSFTDRQVEELGRILSDDERTRAGRYRKPDDRRRSIVSRALLRRSLSTRDPGIAPGDWRFELTERGRPVSEMTELAFNVSHTPGRVAVAIAEARVGVDVESTTRDTDVVAVGKRWFHPAEQEIVTQEPPDRVAFFEFWTLKEAYAKALGMGLAVPFRSIRFDRTPPIRLEREGEPVVGWTFELIEDGPFRIAVAVEATEPAVRLHRGLE